MNFAIVGVAGFIAPRHLQAIASLGHNLVASYDPNDSVGILDRHFPESAFFTSFEKFETYLEERKGTPDQVQFLSVCSPNHVHSDHVKFGLRMGANVICEKPVVLYAREIEELQAYQKKYDRKINVVLQLRLHEKIKQVREMVAKNPKKGGYKVDLNYITSRGPWYHTSWKGDLKRSGGLATNIGVHFFDMLTWIFGECSKVECLKRSDTTEAGILELKNAHVNWSLSIDRRDLPPGCLESGKTTFRSIQIDGEELEFSDGFTELHKEVYQNAISGNGYGVGDAATAIRIVEELRNQIPRG